MKQKVKKLSHHDSWETAPNTGFSHVKYLYLRASKDFGNKTSNNFGFRP